MVITKIIVRILTMTKSTTSKVPSKKLLDFKTKNAIIIGVALIISATINGVPTAAALDQIQTSRDVPASVDKLWNIVSNVSNDPKYWNQIHTVNIITKTENMIQADTTLGPFSAKGHEIVMLHPKQSVVTNIIQGPITGTRIVTLSPLSENKTRIDVSWSIDMSGIPFFARGFAKDNFMKSTEQALNGISQAAAVQ
jgi:ribosome-associated toxin RatA of RatAB toxin-antitoxin module